jgi:hypothetical protein
MLKKMSSLVKTLRNVPKKGTLEGHFAKWLSCRYMKFNRKKKYVKTRYFQKYFHNKYGKSNPNFFGKTKRNKSCLMIEEQC